MARERRRRRRRGSASSHSNPLSSVLGGAAGLGGNLFGDVTAAVAGLPMGVVQTVEHPIRSVEQIGQQYWQTYSPFFRGDFGKGLHNLYDHPLAPILDVLSVVTLGAGAAARGAGALSKAGVASSKIEKVAALRTPKAITIADPKGLRPDQTLNLSTRAGRRAVQEMKLNIEPHLPKWFATPAKQFQYNRLHAQDMAHRVVAKTMMLNSALEAGRLLTDDVEAPKMRAEIAAHTHINLLRHNQAVPEAEAKRLVKGGHVGYVIAPAQVNRQYAQQLGKLSRKEKRYDKIRADNAELAHGLPKIEEELAHANDELARIYAEGQRVVMPAGKTKRPTVRQTMEQEAGPLLDATRRVNDLEARLLKARKSKGLWDDAVHNLDDVKRQRMDLETRSFKDYYAQFGRSAEAFENGMENFGRWATSTDVKRGLKRAARDKDGNVYIVPMHDAHNLGLEAKNSHAFVRHLWHNPTTLWKRIMIGYTPRAITNNAVGNWAIYALREGVGPSSVQAVYDAIRMSKGEREALNSFKAAIPYKRDHWLYRYFADEMGDVFGRELLDDASQFDRAGKVARSGLYPIVHKIADQPVRVASIYSYLRKSPEINRLMHEQGIDFDRAVRQALRKDPALRDMTVQHVRSTAGDYVTLHSWEKPIRDLIPFYLWYRHILRTGWNMTLDTPARLSVAMRLSQSGIQSTEELLGEIPEFLQGAIPLSVLGLDDPKEGRKDILLTASLNPFASLGELSQLAEAFTTGTGARGGAAAAMGLNPFLTSFIEATTGTTLLTGGKTQEYGGVLPTIGVNTLKGLPQVKALDALLHEDTTTSPNGNELLFARDDRSPLSSLLGIPLRSMSPEAAANLANAEGGDTSGRRRRRRRRR